MVADFHQVIFKDPGGKMDIEIKIPHFDPDKSPIVMIQDSKHGMKTFCNNAFSDAHLLVLGNYTIQYEQFW